MSSSLRYSARGVTMGMLAILGAALVVVLPTAVFGFSKSIIPLRLTTTTSLFAEGGPQYDKHQGILQNSECVGKGSYLLTIDYDRKNEDSDDDKEFPHYESGHVLALEIQRPSDDDEASSSSTSSELYTMTEKTKIDSKANGGWMRGPYTVSMGYGTNSQTKDGFKVLIKEVGYKSHVMATSSPGTPVIFGGKFKVPIAQGIVGAANASEDNDSEEEEPTRGVTQRVVLVSSGVGVGPCVGAIEKLFQSSPSSIASIDLIASYRTREEIAMEAALENLRLESTTSSSKPDFGWKPVITSEDDRLSSKGPDFLRETYLQPQSTSSNGDDDKVVSPLTNTHYHVIGNGQLVNEWKEGLQKARVPSSRVTVEAYFNHSAKADPSAVDAICEAVLGLEREAIQTRETAPKEAAVSL